MKEAELRLPPRRPRRRWKGSSRRRRKRPGSRWKSSNAERYRYVFYYTPFRIIKHPYFLNFDLGRTEPTDLCWVQGLRRAAVSRQPWPAGCSHKTAPGMYNVHTVPKCFITNAFFFFCFKMCLFSNYALYLLGIWFFFSCPFFIFF